MQPFQTDDSVYACTVHFMSAMTDHKLTERAWGRVVRHCC